MATRKAKVPTATPWWHPEKLTAHNNKHGTEVALVRQTSVGKPTSTDYENSSRSTIISAFYSIELKHLKDDHNYPPSGYSTDSFGLLTIRDIHTNRIRTHFPIGAFGESQAQWLGTLPRQFRELHALRNIYIRVRCGLYVAKNRKPSEVIEKYLNSLTKKEIECCSLLKQGKLHEITPEAVNWMKLCLVCDWQDARHCVTDASTRSRADEFVGEFMRDAELQTHANNELNTISTDIIKNRLVQSEQSEFLQLLKDNSWTFTEAFLCLGSAMTYQELVSADVENATSSRAIMIKHFRDNLYPTATRPHNFQREVTCFLTAWKNNVKQPKQSPLLGYVHSLIGQTKI